MIDDDLRRELVDTLMRVPGIDAPDRSARDLLLAGIPNALYLQRNPNNARGDVMVSILQLEDTYSAQGVLLVLRMIDNALPQVRDIGLGDELKLLRRQVAARTSGIFRPNPAEYAKPYRFDLRKLVNLSLALVEGPPRLSGFVVQTQSLRFLESFCQSLKHRGHEDRAWDRARVSIPPIKEVDPRHTSVATVIAKSTCVERLLTRHVVILGLKLIDATDAVYFWQEMTTAFPNELDNHLIVLMGVPEGCPVPNGAVELPRPLFERQHVVEWVYEIVATLKWSDSLVTDWVQQIVALACGDASARVLPIDRVYHELEYFRDLLQECSTEEDFRSALQEIRDLGEFYVIPH